MKNGKANPPLLTIIVPLTKMAGKLEIVDSWLRLVNWEVTQGGAFGLVDTYNLDRVSREGSTNDKALSAGVSR